MTILFTGHRGFLGRELIAEIRKYSEVVVFEEDLRDFISLSKFVNARKVDKVIHAAVRGGRRIKIDDAQVLAENLHVGFNILKLEMPTLAFCSGAIYGRQENIYLAKESSSGDRYPADYYGQSKFLFRQIIRDSAHVTLARFFNVFGESETPDRFITANIKRALSGEFMQVFKNFKMDFYYVKDTIPLIRDWLVDKELPQEINMVYPQKYYLTQICELINDLMGTRVQINIDNSEQGKDYCGDGTILKQLNYQMLGLDKGITDLICLHSR